MSLPNVHGFGIGPPSLEVIVPEDGYNTTKIWVTSDGINGTLVIGTDNQIFKVEPSEYPLHPDDVNMLIELKIYGNNTLKPGVYPDKLTFIGYTGESVSMGIKIKIDIEQYSTNNEFSLLGLGLYQILGLLVIMLASIIFLKKNRENKTDETTNQ